MKSGKSFINKHSNQHWTPARMTQWQTSDWAHICERLSRQGLTAYLRHAQSPEYQPPKFIITNSQPTDSENISKNTGYIRYHQILHDRVDAPIIAINQKIVAVPNTVNIHRFNSQTVSHPHQSAQNSPLYNPDVFTASLNVDTPAAFAPVTDTQSVDDAAHLADHYASIHCQYYALSQLTDVQIADTFTLVGHDSLNNSYRLTHIVHLVRNALAHITGLTLSARHKQRHASTLEPSSHLTQLKLITADTPWVGGLYSKQTLPPMTGITEAQSDSDSRDHMTPTRLALFAAPAQPISRMEAQAGANYGTHFTHRADDQTLVQSIGDSEHLINAGSLLSTTRPSLFKADNEKAVESGYRHSAEGCLSEWVTDHRTDNAYSQLNINQGGVSATLKMGIINPATNSNPQRDGIHASTTDQVSVKTGQALIISSQPQTHDQISEHDYQHHTPALTQTSLGGQHLSERLTQLATGLGRHVNSHKDIKTQLESIADEQTQSTHHKTPYTLIDSAADSSYVSEELFIHRAMGEMLSTTQDDRFVTSGKTHHQVSGESTTLVADGSVSLTNAADDIRLSAHTGKLEATAKQDVSIASSTKEVEIVANNKITLNAGGATITLDGANITVAANTFTEKSGKHSTAGGGFDGRFVSGLPSNILAEPPTFIELNYLYDDDTPVSGAPYRVEFADGSVREGTLDDNGYARLEGVPKGQARVYYGEDPAEFKPYINLEDDV